MKSYTYYYICIAILLPLVCQGASYLRIQAGPSNNRLVPKLTCPPKEFNPLPNLNLALFLQSPYYVYAQLPTSFEPENQLYCAKITLTPYNASNIIGKGLKYERFAREGSVTGPIVTSAFSRLLQLKFTNRNVLSKMELSSQQPRVAKFSPGHFWIVAAASDYSWVVATAGAPKTIRRDTTAGSQAVRTCAVGAAVEHVRAKQTGGNGLWLLSRNALVSPADKMAMEAAVAALQLTPEFKTVQHDGCNYSS